MGRRGRRRRGRRSLTGEAGRRPQSLHPQPWRPTHDEPQSAPLRDAPRARGTCPGAPRHNLLSRERERPPPPPGQSGSVQPSGASSRPSRASCGWASAMGTDPPSPAINSPTGGASGLTGRRGRAATPGVVTSRSRTSRPEPVKDRPRRALQTVRATIHLMAAGGRLHGCEARQPPPA